LFYSEVVVCRTDYDPIVSFRNRSARVDLSMEQFRDTYDETPTATIMKIVYDLAEVRPNYKPVFKDSVVDLGENKFVNVDRHASPLSPLLVVYEGKNVIQLTRSQFDVLRARRRAIGDALWSTHVPRFF
jgi:hypothetical protein